MLSQICTKTTETRSIAANTVPRRMWPETRGRCSKDGRCSGWHNQAKPRRETL